MKEIRKIFIASAVFSGALFLAACGGSDGANSNGSLSTTITIDGTATTFFCNQNSSSGQYVFKVDCSQGSQRVEITLGSPGSVGPAVSVRLNKLLDSNGGGGVIYDCYASTTSGTDSNCIGTNEPGYNIQANSFSAASVTLPYDRIISPAVHDQNHTHTISFSIDVAAVPFF